MQAVTGEEAKVESLRAQVERHREARDYWRQEAQRHAQLAVVATVTAFLLAIVVILLVVDAP
jgi:ABC-type proline/glycine betaine transport system permease subunit